jgi:hypothetical protein
VPELGEGLARAAAGCYKLAAASLDCIRDHIFFPRAYRFAGQSSKASTVTVRSSWEHFLRLIAGLGRFAPLARAAERDLPEADAFIVVARRMCKWP